MGNKEYSLSDLNETYFSDKKEDSKTTPGQPEQKNLGEKDSEYYLTASDPADDLLKINREIDNINRKIDNQGEPIDNEEELRLKRTELETNRANIISGIFDFLVSSNMSPDEYFNIISEKIRFYEGIIEQEKNELAEIDIAAQNQPDDSTIQQDWERKRDYIFSSQDKIEALLLLKEEIEYQKRD